VEFNEFNGESIKLINLISLAEIVGDHAFDVSGFLRVRANDCLTFIDAIVAAKIAQEEARETVG
jgi:hypothetical protein